MPNLSPIQQDALRQVLEEYENQYDPNERMLSSEAYKVGYHTTVRGGAMHPTRESLAYAVALLDSGNAESLERAAGILRRVASLQDQDPQSKTYGIWSWYLEEPLEKMSPPDWNWADFCGVQLLAAYRDYRDRLPTDLSDILGQSIVHAARSIERRNVAPSYTNIALMGTYVTLVAAETFGMADLLDYARDRARRVHEYITYHGSFNEYNSPTYTAVAVTEISRLLADAKDGQSRAFMQEIHDLAWKHIGMHFHPPTRQWAGPHSRCYETDLRKRPKTMAFIQAGTRNAVPYYPNEAIPLGLHGYRVPLSCPDEWIPLFASLEREKSVVETFTRADPSKEGQRNAVIGATFLGRRFTLGSVNYALMWDQRRNVLAYWGTPEKTGYLHVRFLHDGHDYSSAHIATVQKDGSVLAALVFAADGGDTHPNLDLLQNATISAEDLRLRFEFGGDIEAIELPETWSSGELITLKDRDIAISIFLLCASFADRRTSIEVHRDDKCACVDVVLYSGSRESFDFSKMNEACVAFCLRMQDRDEGSQAQWDAFARLEGDRCSCMWRLQSETLQVSIPRKPLPKDTLRDSLEMQIL